MTPSNAWYWQTQAPPKPLLYVLFLLPASHAFAVAGAGPADLGFLNYIVLGIWLLFWIGVIIHTLALVVYVCWRFTIWANRDNGKITIYRGRAIATWAIKIHLSATAIMLAVFIFR